MPEADLRTYLHILRKRVGWILLVTIAIAGCAIGLDHVRAKQYTATAQLLVQPASTVSDAVTQQTVTSSQVLTEMQLVTSVPVRLQVQRLAKIGSLTQVPLASTAEVGQSNVISVTVRGPTPREARTIANDYAQAFVAYERTSTLASQTAAESQLQSQINALAGQISALENRSTSLSTSAAAQLASLLNQEVSLKNQLAGLQTQATSAAVTASKTTLQTEINVLAGQITALQTTTTTTSPQLNALLNQEQVLKEELAQLQVNGAIASGSVQLVSPASLPTAPSSPKPLRDGLLAVILGLLLGIGLAILIERLDDAVYSKEDAEAASSLPVLAMVPLLPGWKPRDGPYLVARVDPTSPVTEAYHSLRTALQFADYDGDLKTILVTSPSLAEGKTSTASNLGVVMASTGRRTVLVDCDLRRPRLGKFLGVNERFGFSNVLLDELPLSEALQDVPDVPYLTVLAAGSIPPNPGVVLGSPRAAQIFQHLRETFDFVVIDSPPLLPVADALTLSREADATLLVAASGGTKKAGLRRAAELLSQVNTRTIGVVLNEVTWRAGYSYAGYGYGYEPTPKERVDAHNANNSTPDLKRTLTK